MRSRYEPYLNYLTDVGAYPMSRSAYGTLDQGGNVWQWNESALGPAPGVRGGDFATPAGEAGSSARNSNADGSLSAEGKDNVTGFRVASVP